MAAKNICGNAHKCDNSNDCFAHELPHKHDRTDCDRGCSTHIARKDRPCVSVKSKRGRKVLRKLKEAAHK